LSRITMSAAPAFTSSSTMWDPMSPAPPVTSARQPCSFTAACSDEDILFSIGLCYEKLKDLNQARAYYRKSVTVDLKYSEAYYRIGETFRKERFWENAVHYYKKALRVKPDDVNYLVSMAQAFYNLGEIEPFIFAVQSVMALNSKLKLKSHYEKLAGYLIDLGCIHDALHLIDFAAMEKGTIASFPYLRAACYLQLGERKEGIAWLEEGLNNHYAKRNMLFRFAPELRKDPVIASIIEQYK